MNSLIRRGLIAAALLVLLPTIATAGQSTRYVFAWCYSADSSTFYVSNSSMSVDYNDYSAAVSRWNSARERNNLRNSTRNATAGTPGDIYYGTAQEADDARYRMANQERNSYGKTVVEVPW